MKKTASLALLLIAILTSCKKDIPIAEAVIAMWDVESVTQVTYKDNVKKSESTFFLEANEMAIQFAAGGTGIYYENGDVYGTFSWSIEGSTITITGDPDQVWDITIDKDTLVWSYSQTETTNSITYKYEYIYTAKKSS